MTLLKKLKESKMSKVTIKEVAEKSQEKKEEAPIMPLPIPSKKAKKLSVANPIVIEDDEEKQPEESPEEFVMRPKEESWFC